MEKVVCGCFNVTTEDIKKHLKNGVTRFEELQELTNISTECPPCEGDARKVFEELKKNKD